MAELLSIMLKRTSLAILLAVAGCGDNSPSNFPPILSAPEIDVTMPEDGTATIDATAHDPEDQTISYTATAPGHGTLSGSGPTYTYQPSPHFIGSDALTVTVSDGDNRLTVPVKITITAVAAGPTATPQAVSVDRGGSQAITLTASDADSADLIYEIVVPPSHGTLTGDAPDLTYTPDAQFSGADAFTFRASDTFLTSAPATVTIDVVAVAVCGDGMAEGSEACDDGNTNNNDECTNACALPACGDGIVQLGHGEDCDDGNTLDGDGCDHACHVEPFVTTAVTKISADLTCTTATANAARKITVDGSGNVYAVMACSGSADVTVSHDRGTSFSAPADLSADVRGELSVAQVAIANGPSGVAYAAFMLNNGKIYLRTTEDRGDTWAAPVLVGTAASAGAGLSLQAFNDDIYIGFSTGGGVAVARNHARGAGAFDVTTVAMSIAYFDLLYDLARGTLVVAADTPSYHLRASDDGGVTFGDEVNPPGSEYYSDWTIGNGRIYVSGTNLSGSNGNSTQLFVIATADLTRSTAIDGLPLVTATQTRTVAADLAGNAFIGSQLTTGGIQLDRLEVDGTAFDAPRAINPTGTSPIVAPLPGNQGAAVVFTDGSSVYATIQAYSALP